MLCLVAQSCLTFCEPMDCSPPGSSVHENSPGKNTGVGCHALLQGIFPAQGLNPGLPHCRWILYQLTHQGNPRILEWVAYPFSRGSSWPRIKLGSPGLQADSLPSEIPGKLEGGIEYLQATYPAQPLYLHYTEKSHSCLKKDQLENEQ